MSYDQTPARIAYPQIETNVWVVISRLSETPVRVVPSLSAVNHASEFALPFPTGSVPYKIEPLDIEVQVFDELERPIYDDGEVGGTTSDVDEDGEPLPPLTETISEDTILSLRDYPSMFTLSEVIQLSADDFLRAFPFYDYANILLFDDRYDGTSIYESIQESSGLASGAHPFFLGPIRFIGDPDGETQGHLLLVAPNLEGVNWYWQRRHGTVGVGGGVGPIQDLEQASREEEVFRIHPFTNFPVTTVMLTDAEEDETNHYWLRTDAAGGVDLQRPYPIVPYIMILGRSTNSPDGSVTPAEE